jgi:phenylalanine-4-hydroxylase
VSFVRFFVRRFNYNVFDMNTNIESNPLLDRLPKHLKQFIKPQDYSDYTPINQAVWRYVMRKMWITCLKWPIARIWKD